MSALPSASKSLVPGVACPGLLPIRFGLKAYFDFGRQIDQALSDLEARYPGKPRVITLEARNKLAKRKPK